MSVLKYGNINDMPGFLAKTNPKWHYVVYDMWKDMWDRVYTHINYFGKTIQPKYKYLSGYIEDFQKLENFDLFKENPYGWSIDKDIKGGTYIGYYFQYLSLITRSDNCSDANNRRSYKDIQYNHLHTSESVAKSSKSREKSIIGISLTNKSILIFKSLKDAKTQGFSSNLSKCLKKCQSSHKGYKWYYINYKHNKRLRKISS